MRHTAVLEQWKLPVYRFQGEEQAYSRFREPSFSQESERKKFKEINATLLNMIQEEEIPCFLMPAVFRYVYQINKIGCLRERYSFSLFEFWFNHFSTLSLEENLIVRGKIVGRMIPREEYQLFFPIGMNKYFAGSHFVAAHLSPDIDTTVASFVGWIDAFGAKVSQGLHQWNLPHGMNDGYLIELLDTVFCDQFLTMAPMQIPQCAVSAIDLVTKKNVHKVSHHTDGRSIEHQGEDEAYIVIDDHGLYKGEWRSSDAESVRIVISTFSSSLRWVENSLQRSCIHALGESSLSVEGIHQSLEKALLQSLAETPSVRELSERSRRLFDDYLKSILTLPDGVNASFRDLVRATDKKFSSKIESYVASFTRPIDKDFSKAQSTDRDALRLYALELLEKLILVIAEEIKNVGNALERMDRLLEVKHSVLKTPPQWAHLKSSLEEIKAKIEHFSYVTVVVSEGENASFPLGVVWANDIKKQFLATASLRDFSTLEETKMAPYVDVISIIDHHRSKITTSASSTLVLGDAQSCNTLIAELSYSLNHAWSGSLQPAGFFVDPSREMFEYLLYIIAILDDTDLLTKVSRRDVLCLEKLLNRMCSLVAGRDLRVVAFDDLPQGPNFTNLAAKKLLANHELHAIYKNIYAFRERALEEAIHLAAKGEKSILFSDTKEQNGMCRIGQTKRFAKNMPSYERLRGHILEQWVNEAGKARALHPHLQFFLQMMSTVPGADEVSVGAEVGAWRHKDEIWIATAENGSGEQYLGTFLSLFQNSQTGQMVPIDIFIEGKGSEHIAHIVRRTFPKAMSINVVERKDRPAVVILSFQAGLINSRKAQISPFLPK